MAEWPEPPPEVGMEHRIAELVRELAEAQQAAAAAEERAVAAEQRAAIAEAGHVGHVMQGMWCTVACGARWHD